MQTDASHLTDLEVKEIEALAIRAPDEDLSYSAVFQAKLLTNPSAETGNYTVVTDSGEAEVVRRGSRYAKLTISGTEVSYILESFGIEFEIYKDDIKASKMFGRPLDMEYVERAVRAAQEKLNKIAYVGDTKFGTLPGVVELSGVTAITGTDLDTANLNLFNEVQIALNSIPSKYRRRNYTLVVADKEFKKFTAIGNTTTDDSWLTMIEKNIRNLKVVMDDEIIAGAALAGGGTIATGTAMLIPYEKTLARLPIAKELKAVMDKNSITNEYEEAVRGKIAGKVGPVEVPFPAAVGKITSWDA